MWTLSETETFFNLVRAAQHTAVASTSRTANGLNSADFQEVALRVCAQILDFTGISQTLGTSKPPGLLKQVYFANRDFLHAPHCTPSSLMALLNQQTATTAPPAGVGVDVGAGGRGTLQQHQQRDIHTAVGPGWAAPAPGSGPPVGVVPRAAAGTVAAGGMGRSWAPGHSWGMSSPGGHGSGGSLIGRIPPTGTGTGMRGGVGDGCLLYTSPSPRDRG